MTYFFKNEGIILQRTNYFDSIAAKKGEFYITSNSGCLRLLVPDIMKTHLKDMRCEFVVIDKIKGGYRVIFEDNSDTPLNISIAKEQVDIQIKPGRCTFSVYIKLGEKFRYEAICN